MTTTILSAALSLQLFSGPNGPFLRKLAEVESGMNTNARGAKGERGLYQFRRVTWKSVSYEPFLNCLNPAKSTAYAGVALVGLDYQFFRHFRELGIERFATGPELYCLWNMGFRGFQKRHFRVEECPMRTRINAAKFDGLEFK